MAVFFALQGAKWQLKDLILAGEVRTWSSFCICCSFGFEE